MKTRICLFIILTALVLLACAPTVQPPSEVDTEIVTGKCIRNSDEVRLLINSVHQYCLQYPAEYDVFQPNDSEIMLFKRSVLSVSEPSVSINVQPADVTTVDQAADGFLAVYTFPESELVRESLTIDGQEAIMLDGLPGQEINRRVFVLHNGYLYQLIFSPMDKNQPEVYAQSETLYRTVVRSFNFRPESNACSDCPMPEEDHRSASISGWIWHDLCEFGKDSNPPLSRLRRVV